MKKVPVISASAGQLAQFAATHYGLDVNAKMGAAKIRALLDTAGFRSDHIEVEEEVPAPAARPPVSTEGRKYVTVLIATQEGPGGSDPVPVGVNGKAMLIPRGEPQRVPVEFYEVLMNAKKKVYDPRPDGQGMLPPREVLTYPAMLIPDLPS